MNALDIMDQELAQASILRVSHKPLFLFLKDGHKALIRPLSELKDAIVLRKHNRYSEDPNERINAICAREDGKDCIYCQKAVNDKKLTAQMYFYLPVYVYGILNQATGQKLTFTKKDENGSETSEEISGIRLLELSAYGSAGKILKSFREFMKEDDSPAITALDFTLTQVGSMQKKDFVLMPKMPKAMPEQVKETASALNLSEVRTRILEACPPVTAEEGYHPAIDAVVQGVKNGHQAVEVLDDTITDW